MNECDMYNEKKNVTNSSQIIKMVCAEQLLKAGMKWTFGTNGVPVYLKCAIVLNQYMHSCTRPACVCIGEDSLPRMESWKHGM